MYTFWRWIRQKDGPSWRRCLTAAVVLGLALGVKSTALMLWPIFGVFILAGRPPQRPLKSYLGQALAAGGVALVVLWTAYRFEFGPAPGGTFPIPAPSYLLPLLKLQEHMREGHSAFLMGQNYHHGVWYYFPIAFALKTPPLTLTLLLLTALGLAVRRVRSAGRRGEAALLALPLLYFGVSLTSGINIGYRHLLPILPFLFVWVSRLAFHVSRLTFYALLTCYAAVTLALFPWHLAYFNLLAGGVDGGYRYLTDSNLDWGQTWKALKRYVDEQDVAEFGLSQYTINDPRAYGLDYTPLPPWPAAPPVLPRRFDPAPGVYAISATTLQGVVVADSEMFDYFRKVEPVARIGHAMFVYQVSDRPPGEWAAQCTVPVAPLPPEVLAEGLGRDDLRLVYFDCSQSWLYPPGDGWYVLARDAAHLAMSLAHTQRARLAYEQTRASFTPPFAVYEWLGQDQLSESKPDPVYAAPSAWPPTQVEAEGTMFTQPVQVGGGIEFLGYTAPQEVQAGSQAIAQTYWRVTQMPTQPLSLMAHLLDANGVPVSVGDGLGVSIDQWRPGDVIVQLHALTPPPGTAPGVYWLQTGAYTLPDVQRLPVLQNGRAVGDRLLIGRIEVIAP
jgi:uncharacterized membrane protein YhaH (DUF805 family)